MSKTILASALALALSSGIALAQGIPAPAAGGTPPPAGAAGARPAPAAGGPAANAASGSFGRGANATTAAAARQMAEQRMASRKSACEAKGPAYEFRPPHVIGDANPAGGFYASNFNGGCKLMSMQKAIQLGIVSVNASARRQ